mgnify:CR=1 FL=1
MTRRALRRGVSTPIDKDELNTGRLDDFLSLMRRCWRTRAYGDFWSYMLLAEGAVDLAAEPELEVYDMAALDRTFATLTVEGALREVLLPVMRDRTGSWVGWDGTIDGSPDRFDFEVIHDTSMQLDGEVYLLPGSTKVSVRVAPAAALTMTL